MRVQVEKDSRIMNELADGALFTFVSNLDDKVPGVYMRIPAGYIVVVQASGAGAIQAGEILPGSKTSKVRLVEIDSITIKA